MILHRLFSMKSVIAGAIGLLLSAPLLCQSTHGEGDIVQELMPDGIPPQTLRLTATQRIRAIKQLQAAQKQTIGKHAQQIAFLLAALGSKYNNNRDYLVQALQGCSRKPVQDNCDEDTAGLLIALYDLGHHEVLRPLLVAGVTSAAALSEMLGSFYSDVLIQNSAHFIEAIRPLTKLTQKEVCFLAGSTDGGGMASRELKKARKQLRAVGDEVALRCLRQIETANNHQ